MKNLIKFKFFYVIQIAVDVGLIHLGYILAFWLRYLGTFPEANFPAYIELIPWISLLSLIMFLVFGLYHTKYKRWIEIFVGIVWVAAFIFAGNMALSFLFRQFAFPRTVLVLGFLFHLTLLSLWQYGVWKYGRKVYGQKKVVVVGNSAQAQLISEKIAKNSLGLYHVLGIVVPQPDDSDQAVGVFPIICRLENFPEVFLNHDPEIVFICPDLPKEDKIHIMMVSLENQCEVNLIPDFYEVLVAQARVYQVDDFPVLYINNFMLSSGDRMFKRLIDLLISLALLIITGPFMLLIALFIKIDSPGPVLFKQERVGKKGKVFFLYKFRTMIHHAEKFSGPVLSSNEDSRVTKIGRFLRQTRMDELPQFINVIKGEMSIIGPRPERPFFVEQFNRSIEGYDFRHQLAGGMTGFAQISGKYSTTAEDKLRFDLLYTKNYSPLKDLQILFNTLKVLLIKDKAS